MQPQNSAGREVKKPSVILAQVNSKKMSET